jgi:N-terminal acetyltransferase B complex non-catalytic subunit
VLGNGSDSL